MNIYRKNCQLFLTILSKEKHLQVWTWRRFRFFSIIE